MTTATIRDQVFPSSRALLADMPGVTYSGGPYKWDRTAAGVYVPVAGGDPGGTDAGYGSWQTRTNYLVNPRGRGAVVGDISTTGALPTNWARLDAVAGLSVSVVASGAEDGIPGVYLRVQGTPGSSGDVRLSGYSGGVSVSNGAQWLHEIFARVTAGSLSNIGAAYAALNWRDGTPATVQTSAGSPGTNGTLSGTFGQIYVVGTAANGAIANLVPEFRLPVTAGQAVDVTVFIGGPQLKSGAYWGDPPILQENPNAATRNGDTLAFVGLDEIAWSTPVIFIDADIPNVDGLQATLFDINAGGAPNRIIVSRDTSNKVTAQLVVAGLSPGFVRVSALKTGARRLKVALNIRATGIALAADGALHDVASGTITAPYEANGTSLTQLNVGWSTGIAGGLSVTRSIQLFPDMPDSALAALTA